MKTFAELKKNLNTSTLGLKRMRVALLGDTATQFLAASIKGTAIDSSLNLEIWEAEFNQIEQQVFDEQSELYSFCPEVIIIFHSTHKLLSKYNKLTPQQRLHFSDETFGGLRDILAALNGKLKANIVYYNFPEIDDNVFGNFANKIESSFLYQLRKLNVSLMALASHTGNFFLVDLASVQNFCGRSKLFQASIYVNTDMVISIEGLPHVAKKTVDLLSALAGHAKKCLILDLDNTLWGGVIGDDGLENIQIGNLGIGKAFSEFQYWIKKLKGRGIIIAVCSKNTDSVAKEPFEKHPDMVLQLEDIAVFVANWEDKVHNIRQIQEILNIGFDSMVFLDDNPFERNMVRQNIPELCVPELPEDPAEYLEFLYTQQLFETIAVSVADEERTKQYQVEAQRAVEKKSFTSQDDYLQSLRMVSLIESLNRFNIPRVAQLSQRSNQFNLRTVRYTEGDLERLSLDHNFYSFAFGLTDKFGDNGLICVVLLHVESATTLFIETWFMSCRVLKRGMEQFVLNTLARFAREKGFTHLKGEYIPTTKNGMVSSHYEGLGFVSSGNFWLLEITKYESRPCFIQAKDAFNENTASLTTSQS